jgi:Flp pilus assembly protein TadD
MLLAIFLSAVGARSTEIAVLQRGLTIGGHEAWFLERFGAATLAEGRYDEADAAFRRLLERAPRSETALDELAFLAYRRGQLDEAARLLQRLVQVAPRNAGYRQNLERVEAARRGSLGSPAGR